jgi:hypothetical protein
MQTESVRSVATHTHVVAGFAWLTDNSYESLSQALIAEPAK